MRHLYPVRRFRSITHPHPLACTPALADPVSQCSESFHHMHFARSRKYLFMMFFILPHHNLPYTTSLSWKAGCHDMSLLDCNLLTPCEQVHARRVAADFKSRIRHLGVCNNSTSTTKHERLCQEPTYIPMS